MITFFSLVVLGIWTAILAIFNSGSGSFKALRIHRLKYSRFNTPPVQDQSVHTTTAAVSSFRELWDEIFYGR